MSQEPSRHQEASPTAAGADHESPGALVDNAGDLDYTTARLRQREQELLGEYERNAKVLDRLGAGGSGVTGRGWAADQAVVATVDASNRLVDLELDPRALRLGSIENLRKAIMTAYDLATEDVADQLRDAGLAELPADPVRAMLDSMPELTAIMPEGTYTPFLTPPASSAKGDGRRASREAAAEPDWEEKNPYV